MGNFSRNNNRSNRGFGGGGFGGGKNFSRGNSDRPTMHKAICDECGDNCEIPFRPSAGRPVFCSNCFEKQDGGGRPNKFGGGRERRERPSYEDRQMHSGVCATCGKNCQVPFRPTAGKPIFCDDCFSKEGKGNKGSKEIMEQMKQLNAKVDKILNILAPKTPEKKKPVMEAKKPEVAKKTKMAIPAKKVEKTKNTKKKAKVAVKKVVTKKKK